MNLAFGTVLIFVIFLPGIIWQQTFRSGLLSSRLKPSSAADQVLLAVIPATLLHAAMIFLFGRIGYHVDFGTIGILLIGPPTDQSAAAALDGLVVHSGIVFLYNVGVWVLAFVSGWSIREIVTRTGADMRLLPELVNDWHYLFLGRRSNLKLGRDYDYVWIDALTRLNGSQVLYSGILDGWQFSRSGDLQIVYLRDATRREVRLVDTESVKEAESEGTEIPGDTFAIRFEHVINVNVSYYDLSVLRRTTVENTQQG